MSIELTFVGYQDLIPIYMPINKSDQEALKGHSVIECNVKKNGTRTSKQNRALHLWIRKLVLELDNAGLDMKAVLKPTVDIPWTDALAKQYLWKPVQMAMLGKESTKELETDEVSKVYETLNRHMANKFGVSIPFPEIFRLLYEEENNQA
jgi:hypothetical protein